MDPGGVPDLVCPVHQWVTHCQEPLCRYAHHQECLPGHQDILQRVPEVREHVDVYGGGGITEDITEDDADKEKVNDCKGDQTVVESGSTVLPANNDDSSNIARQPHHPHHGQGHHVHVEGGHVQQQGVRAGAVGGLLII